MRPILSPLIVVFTTTVAHACPNCGKAVEVLPSSTEGGVGAGAAGGFNGSIYLLLGTVIVAMMFLAWHLMRAGKVGTKQPDVPIAESRTT